LTHRLGDGWTVLRASLEGLDVTTEDDLAVRVMPRFKGQARPADALREYLAAQKRAVLLLDEVAYLRQGDVSVFTWLRKVGQEVASVVYAGSHWDWQRVTSRVAEVMSGSSFGNDTLPVDLGQISREDALDFLTRTAPKDVPLARDRTATWVVDVCGPWPFYLQAMGEGIVHAVRSQNRREALVDMKVFKDLYKERLLGKWAIVFRTRWDELPPEIHQALLRDPVGEPPAFKTLPQHVRLMLVAAGLCRSDGSWVEDKPFFDWVKENENNLRGDAT
jgi:hypothetical protein